MQHPYIYYIHFIHIPFVQSQKNPQILLSSCSIPTYIISISSIYHLSNHKRTHKSSSHHAASLHILYP